MTNTLGEELSTALTNITALIVKTDSKDLRDRLLQQQADIAGQLQVFVDCMVDETLDEYRAATQALNDANKAATAAKQKLDNVAKVVSGFANALDRLTALASKVLAA